MNLRAALVRQLPTGLPATFWWLWSGALVCALATFVFPFLALYFTARGLDAQRAGLLVSLLGVGAIVAGPLAGTLADRVGRKPALFGALLGSAAAAAWLGAVSSLALIAPGVFAFGVCASMCHPAINAIATDVVSEEQVPRTFGLLYWANNLGIGFSALIGGTLAARSWLLVFSLDAASTLLFAALVWRRIPETRPAPRGEAPLGWAHVRADRALLWFLAAELGFMLIFWQLQFALPLAMARDGLGAATFGRALAANCVLILFVQQLLTRLTGHIGTSAALALSAVLLGCGYGGYSLCHSAPQYYLATVVWTVGEALGLPAAAALVAELAPIDLRGRYQGSFSLCTSVGLMLAPIVSGAVIAHAGFRALWAGCFALGLAVAAAQLFLGAQRKARPAPALRA